jgi:defect in organelle trafficking protein DotA
MMILKRKTVLTITLLLLSLFVTEAAWAGFFDAYINPEQDKSVEFIGMIFGTVGTILNGSGGPLFGELFRIFNIIVFTLGSILLSYTTIVSMINTAQEGEVMGRKWSSLWLPLRSALGMGVLLPLSSGYSLIQVMMMWVVLQGIGAANELWYTLLSLSEKGYSINISPTKPPFATDPTLAAEMKPIIDLIFASTICKNFLNSTALAGAQQAITIYTVPQCAASSECVNIGIQNSLYPDLTNACGSFTFSLPAGADPALVQQAVSALTTALYSADQAVNGAVNYALDSVLAPKTPALMHGGEMLNTTLAAQQKFATLLSQSIPAQLFNQIEENYYLSIPTTFKSGGHSTKTATIAQQNGWLFMGSYYYLLSNSLQDSVTQTGGHSSGIFSTFKNTWENRTKTTYKNTIETFPSASPSSSSADNTPPLASVSQINAKTAGIVYQSLSDYLAIVAAIPSPTGPVAPTVPDDVSTHSFNSGFLNAIFHPINKFFSKVATQFMNYLTTNSPDPLMAIRNVGVAIMSTIENGFIVAIGVVMATSLLGSIGSAFASLAFAIESFIALIFPIATALAALLWSAGALMGLYLPLIPYLLFLFGGIGWIIGVVESMVAAPIVALGIATPSQNEHFGTATPAVMLITSLFLRPALMVIGFVAASKLFVVAIQILNLTFLSVATAQGITTNLGLLSSIALVVTYSGIVITLTHKSFSLIHHVPDKVLRWIGGQGEQLGEAAKHDLEKTERTSQHGVDAGQKMAVAGYNKAGSRNEIQKEAHGKQSAAFKNRMKKRIKDVFN